ncbi:hypothetical protein ACNOYE_37850 [Nannocystaceae bacterium ST9]
MRSRVLARSFALSTCLALGLVALAPTGCRSGKQSLEELTIPAEGVALRYQLVAGASYEGSIVRRETLAAREGRFNRNLSFSVQLIVSSVDETGTARVAATVSNIAIDWTVPGMPMSIDEFNANAKKVLEGVTIRFAVDPQGRVSDIPAAPPNLDEATIGVLDSVIDGLTSAFYVLPADPLTAGETWDDSITRGREGKLGKYVEETMHGSLAGLFEKQATKQKLASLRIEKDRNETTTTKSGSTSTRVRSTTAVFFDVDADYMTGITSKMTSTQGPNTTTVQFSATWTQSSEGGGAAVSEPAVVQKIGDPCNDDYVGPDECLDPCSSNYMGEEPCPAAGGETSTGEASSSGEAAEGETSTTTG